MWVNHHHLIHAVRGVSARWLWYASFFIFPVIPAMYFLPEKKPGASDQN
jgi:hypothetical protein